MSATSTVTFDPAASDPQGDPDTLIHLATPDAAASTSASINQTQRFSIGGGFLPEEDGTEQVLLSTVTAGSGIEVTHGTDGIVRDHALSGGNLTAIASDSAAITSGTWFYVVAVSDTARSFTGYVNRPAVIFGADDSVRPLLIGETHPSSTNTDPASQPGKWH